MIERLRRLPGRRLAITALVFALVTGFAADASAVTIGQTGGGVDCTGNFSLADVSYLVPDGGGTISSFAFQSAASNAGQQVDFLALRTVTGTTYRVVGRTGLVTLKGTGMESFPARIPVAAGDVLGMYQAGITNCARLDNNVVVLNPDPGQTDPQVGDVLPLAGVANASLDLNESATLSPAATSVVCSATSVRIGEPTTCTATVTGSGPPSGTVSFAANASGTVSPATCTLMSIGGNQARCAVTFTPTALGGGVATVYANYAGDAHNPASHGSTTVTVTAGPSATSLRCSPGTVAVDRATTCTATVTGASHPTGTVVFASNASGAFSSKTCKLVSIGGNQAHCSVTYTPASTTPSTHKVYADYSGDATNPPSRATTTITVII